MEIEIEVMIIIVPSEIELVPIIKVGFSAFLTQIMVIVKNCLQL